MSNIKGIFNNIFQIWQFVILAAYTRLNEDEEKVLQYLINNVFVKLKDQETWEVNI
jgi:hypothetical protein